MKNHMMASCFVLAFLCLALIDVDPIFGLKTDSAPMTDESSAQHRQTRSSSTPMPFNSSEITDLVNKINMVRGQVDPEASNMEYVSWNDNLTSMSQRWSDGCQLLSLASDTQPNISPYPTVHASAAFVSPSDRDGLIGIAFMNRQSKWFNYTENTCSSQCLDYIHLVWANATAVGCAQSFCPAVTGTGFRNVIHVTCYFGPGRDRHIPGIPLPYLRGPSCSACASNTASCSANLCRELPRDPPTTPGNVNTICRLACQNGGTLDEAMCECNCSCGYQGDQCEQIKDQVRNGVAIPIHTSINQWSNLRATFERTVGNIVTSWCNDNFKACCPQQGTLSSSFSRLGYVDESHVTVADGFPKVVTHETGLSFDIFRVLFVVTPPETTELCSAGSKYTSGSGTRRVYLDQDALFRAISGNIANLTSELGVPIGDVEKGMVESDSGNNGLAPWAIALIVIFVLLIVVIILAVCVCCVMRGRKSEASESAEIKAGIPPVNKAKYSTGDGDSDLPL